IPCRHSRGGMPILHQLRYGLSALKQTFSGFVYDLPVSTPISVAGGVEWFNFPKYLADITFRETANHRICSVREFEGKDLVMEFQGQKSRRLLGWGIPERLRTMDVELFPQIGGVPHRAV